VCWCLVFIHFLVFKFVTLKIDFVCISKLGLLLPFFKIKWPFDWKAKQEEEEDAPPHAGSNGIGLPFFFSWGPRPFTM
jgi:hypothetical protein